MQSLVFWKVFGKLLTTGCSADCLLSYNLFVACANLRGSYLPIKYYSGYATELLTKVQHSLRRDILPEIFLPPVRSQTKIPPSPLPPILAATLLS